MLTFAKNLIMKWVGGRWLGKAALAIAGFTIAKLQGLPVQPLSPDEMTIFGYLLGKLLSGLGDYGLELLIGLSYLKDKLSKPETPVTIDAKE